MKTRHLRFADFAAGNGSTSPSATGDLYRAAQSALPPIVRDRAFPDRIAGALLMLLIVLVHSQAVPVARAADGTPGGTPPAAVTASQDKSKVAAEGTPPRQPIAELPIPVLEMRDAILAAVHHGAIEELRTAIDWNELPPEFGLERATDPIEAWRKQSKDGEGFEILAILGELLAEPPAKLPLGRDLENNDVFVWPYLAEIKPSKLTPAQRVELFQLVPADAAAAMLKSDTWNWYRLVIAADGTWHLFSKAEPAAGASQR